MLASVLSFLIFLAISHLLPCFLKQEEIGSGLYVVFDYIVVFFVCVYLIDNARNNKVYCFRSEEGHKNAILIFITSCVRLLTPEFQIDSSQLLTTLFRTSYNVALLLANMTQQLCGIK